MSPGSSTWGRWRSPVRERREFLAALSSDDRAALLAVARRRTYPPGSIVLFEDDPPDHVVVVDRGHVKVAATVDDHEVVVDVCGPGALLGELGAIDGATRSAQATALTVVTAWSVRMATFEELLARRPGMLRVLLADLAGRLRDTTRRQVEYGALDGVGRVCRRLVELMTRFGDPDGTGVVITAPLTQRDIAAWAGLSREAVVKALQALRRDGLVTTTARSITVLDVEAVRARAALAS